MALKCKRRKTGSHYFTVLVITFLILITNNGCTVKYSLTGASISPAVKTISIQYFQNRAGLVQPGLSQYITDKLIDKCKAQTSLKFTNGTGDVTFEGEITRYYTVPLTVAGDAMAASNRFSIEVKVKFTNSVQPELSFDQVFSRYEDYSSSLDLNQVEKDLSDKIIELIIEDIFNKAFVNW
jgi:hypothetical protein